MRDAQLVDIAGGCGGVQQLHVGGGSVDACSEWCAGVVMQRVVESRLRVVSGVMV